MPTVPRNNKCAQLGCNNARSRLNAFCLEHGGRDTNTQKATEERKAFNSAYQTAFWRQLRVIQLSKQPMCACCLCRGIITPAEHVDHVFPWARLSPQAFKRNIFQSLCQSCHTIKTRLEAQGICMHYVDGIAHEFKLSDYQRIIQTE